MFRQDTQKAMSTWVLLFDALLYQWNFSHKISSSAKQLLFLMRPVFFRVCLFVCIWEWDLFFYWFSVLRINCEGWTKNGCSTKNPSFKLQRWNLVNDESSEGGWLYHTNAVRIWRYYYNDYWYHFINKLILLVWCVRSHFVSISRVVEHWLCDIQNNFEWTSSSSTSFKSKQADVQIRSTSRQTIQTKSRRSMPTMTIFK